MGNGVSVYRARLSGLSALGTSITVTLANRPAPGIVGRVIYVSDQDEVQIDTGTTWKTLGAITSGGGLVQVRPLQTISAGGQVTVTTDARLFVPVQSSGGVVLPNASNPIAPPNEPGQELILQGNSNVDTVIFPGNILNLRLNGDWESASGRILHLVAASATVWREIARQ